MNAIERNNEKLISDLKRVVRDSEELLASPSGVVGDKAKAREVRERLSEALKTANRTCRALEDRSVDTAKAAGKLVREHPYQSVGVALGVGFLLGMVISRK